MSSLREQKKIKDFKPYTHCKLHWTINLKS